MKRIVLSLILIVTGFALKAQVPISQLPVTTNPSGYIPLSRNGYTYKVLTDSIAAGKLDSLKVSNDTLYSYSRGVRTFVGVIVGGSGSSIDTTSLSNRINLKLNITDTTNKWLSVGWLTSLMKYTDTASKTWDWNDITGKPNVLLASDTTSKTWDWSDITGKPSLIVAGDTTLMLNPYLRKVDTANIKPRLYAGSNVTITGTYPNLTISSTGGGGSSDSSTLFVDTTYNRLAHQISTDSLMLKSLRIQQDGSDVTPTVTDSTLSFNLTGGGGGDTVAYSYNPADWLVSLPHRTLPYFYTSGVAGDPSGSYYETSQYTPTPIHITNGTNKGKLFVVNKGDFQRALFGWISSDKGFTWDTTGVVLRKSATGWDKAGVSMAHMIYDSATNIIHMWYMGYSDSLYPPKFGVGYATASGDSPSVFTKQGEVLSGTSVQTQMGLPHYTGYVKVSSVVKSRETGKYVYHGCYWPGNASNWPDTTMRLWQGVSTNPGDPIDSMQEILAPTGTNTLLENPTVWYGDDGAYWMIYTNGYMDNTPVGGIDSAQYLQVARTASLKNPNWIKQPGIVFYPTKDSTWMGKRVYNAQLLKNTSDYYDRPISLLHDSSGRDTDNLYETQWMLFYSASYPNSYHDQASIIRLTPQKQGQYTASIGYNGTAPNIIQKNGSMQVNIPFVDTLKKISGGITWEHIRDLYRSVKTGTMGRIAYYDSSLRRVRDLPTMSVTVGSYPTFTFGASGYSAASVYFRNGVGTTGMISEDGGMNYYGSSTYMSHYFRDKVSGGIVLSRLFSSGGNSYAYFTGKTAFGSTNTATSHLQADKTFAAVMTAAKTSAYTAADDYTIICDGTSAAFTVSLPQVANCPGRIYIIKKIDSSANAITIDGSGSEPIDGAATISLAAQWKYVMIQSTGNATNGWYIIANN